MITDTLPILNISILEIVRVMFLFAIGLYVLFSIIIVRQVQLMTDTLNVGLEAPVRVLAVIHLVVSLGVFVLALVIL